MLHTKIEIIYCYTNQQNLKPFMHIMKPFMHILQQKSISYKLHVRLQEFTLYYIMHYTCVYCLLLIFLYYLYVHVHHFSIFRHIIPHINDRHLHDNNNVSLSEKTPRRPTRPSMTLLIIPADT